MLLNKRIAILGAGAVGSYIGSKLVESGFKNVDFIARSGYKSLKENGLIIKNYTNNSPYNLKVNAFAKLEGEYDLILICVKSKDTQNVAEQAVNHLSNTGYVVSIQNGVENPDIISVHIKPEKVITNVIYLTAIMQEKGVLEYDAEAMIVYGNINGCLSKEIEEYGEILKTAGIKAVSYTHLTLPTKLEV